MNPMVERVPPRLRRSWVQRGILLMNVFLIGLSLSVAFLLNYGYGRAASINRVALGRSLTTVPEDLEPGERVMNILLVGSDSSANLDEDDPIQIGRQGERFGDVIIIAHIDERSGEIALLSLPRDLWVDIAGSGRSSRINRAFVTGGPVTLIETIETEFGIPIHHYVNVDFAGFQGLVSAVGSVEVFFETPARDWNVNAKPVPRSQTGFVVAEAGCRSLDAETALAYVRSRYYQTQDEDGDWVTDPTSDLGRIRRQQDFLRRTIQRAIDVGARNPFVLRDLIDTGLDNVAIDQRLTPQLLVDLGMAYRSFDPGSLQTYSFPAVDGQVGQNRVLLPLADEAEPVLALFKGAEFDDPRTVSLTVRQAPADTDTGSVTDDDTDDVTDGSGSTGRAGDGERDERILGGLDRSGFDYRIDERADLAEGVVVLHGPDGRHAAELVASGFDDPVFFEQVGGLVGRSVVLSLGPPAEPAAEVALGAPGQQAERSIDDNRDGSSVGGHQNAIEADDEPGSIDQGNEGQIESGNGPARPEDGPDELELGAAACG